MGGQDPEKGTAHGALKCPRGTAQRALHGPGGLPKAPWAVRGDNLMRHGQSRGTGQGGDHLKCDSTHHNYYLACTGMNLASTKKKQKKNSTYTNRRVRNEHEYNVDV